jgi:hypothetical protein
VILIFESIIINFMNSLIVAISSIIIYSMIIILINSIIFFIIMIKILLHIDHLVPFYHLYYLRVKIVQKNAQISFLENFRFWNKNF